MPHRRTFRQLLVSRPAVLFAIWSVPAWLMVLQMHATALANGTPLPPWRLWIPALAEWYLWVVLTPIVWRVARTAPPAWPPPLRTLAIHAVGIVLASLARGVVYATATLWIAGARVPTGSAAYLRRLVIGWLPTGAVVYGAVLAAGTALLLARRARLDQLRAARLGGRLARAELATLRAHLEPHFLFNSLHTVGALVRSEDRAAAVGVVTELSALLRDVLRRDAPDEVPLEDELVFARRYLDIQCVRFGPRLRVEWAVDPEVRLALVPRMALQPLVDNAVRHGIGRAGDAGRVRVAACREGDDLVVTVTDDGLGPEQAATAVGLDDTSAGMGLEATRARVRRLYGPRASVVIADAAPRGTVATVRLPYRTSGPPR